jgi:hypothetical protein
MHLSSGHPGGGAHSQICGFVNGFADFKEIKKYGRVNRPRTGSVVIAERE